MKYSWSKTVIPIAAIFSFRMLGLFLLIPVFSVYALNLQGATPTLIGFALGAYGLTQGLLQMPLGMLSDRFGRKPILTIGLIIFASGSLLGAITDSIYGIIFARIVQGTGAIGSVLIALLADLTPDEQRTKAMAVIGMTIGTSFSIAMILSPSIASYYGLAGIFYFTAILACLGILVLHLIIPTPLKERFHADSEADPNFLKSVIHDKHLQKLNLGIFCQHFILTSSFYALPLLLRHHIKLGHLTQQWHFYLPLMLFSFVLMIPFIIIAEKKNWMKSVFLMSIASIVLAQALLARTSQDWYSLCLLMFIYFVAFNILEATLPSLVSKQSPSNCKGTAMGIYSSSQFLGLFAGGALAGILYQWDSSQGIFIINAIIGFIWLFLSFSLQPYGNLTTLIFSSTSNTLEIKSTIQSLLKLKGIKEVAYSSEEQVFYVRIMSSEYIPGSAESILNKTI